MDVLNISVLLFILIMRCVVGIIKLSANCCALQHVGGFFFFLSSNSGPPGFKIFCLTFIHLSHPRVRAYLIIFNSLGICNY